MSLSPIKHEILEALFLHGEPVKARQLAKEMGKEFPPVMMHLLGLMRLGFALSPEKGLYIISEKGKKALGIPSTTKEKAIKLLEQAPTGKEFHFYIEIGKPLNLYACDLLDFCKKIANVTVDSVEFHLNRGDFEAWFASFGDAELTKKAALLKQKKLKGEELRKRLVEIAENRCIELSKIVSKVPASPE